MPALRVVPRRTATVTASVITAYVHWTEWALFVSVLANQGGVRIPVAPALLDAGALAGSGSLRVGGLAI